MKIVALVLGSLGLLALCACGSGAGAAKGPRTVATGGSTGPTTGTPTSYEPVRFETIAKGDASAIGAQEDALVTDPWALDRVWDRHTAGASPAPRFDFHNYAIVATFQGEHPTPRHDTEVVRIERAVPAGDIYVTVRDFSPGTWGRQIAQRSAPYHMVSIPRPAAGARLIVRRQRRLDFQVLQSGSQSLIGQGDPSYGGDLLAFRTLTDFYGFWWTHTTDPIPAVDFTQEMVVAVLAGYRPAFGHSVETRRVVADPASDEVRVDFEVHPYRGGAAPPQVTETPFQVLRVSLAAGATIQREIRSPLGPVELARGQNAVYQGPRDVLFARDQAELSALIQSHVSGGQPFGIPGPIDFSRDQVVLALLGPQSGTVDVTVARAEMLEDGELEIEVHTMALSTRPVPSPYHMVRIPQTFGPTTVRWKDVTPRP